MGKALELIGKKFGNLTVVSRAENTKWGTSRWNCICECGNSTIVYGTHLTSGRSTSCGCHHREWCSKQFSTHGDTGTRLHRIWKAMKSRCSNPNLPFYKYYGGKGIKVCAEWSNDYISFKEWSLSHGYKENLTIDRIDPDGNYEPNNCRWVTMTVQNRNKKGLKNV